MQRETSLVFFENFWLQHQLKYFEHLVSKFVFVKESIEKLHKWLKTKLKLRKDSQKYLEKHTILLPMSG